jgi:hypothetical protein
MAEQQTEMQSAGGHVHITTGMSRTLARVGSMLRKGYDLLELLWTAWYKRCTRA